MEIAWLEGCICSEDDKIAWRKWSYQKISTQLWWNHSQSSYSQYRSQILRPWRRNIHISRKNLETSLAEELGNRVRLRKGQGSRQRRCLAFSISFEGSLSAIRHKDNERSRHHTSHRKHIRLEEDNHSRHWKVWSSSISYLSLERWRNRQLCPHKATYGQLQIPLSGHQEKDHQLKQETICTSCRDFVADSSQNRRYYLGVGQ